MSSIAFDATFNTDDLDKGIETSRKEIKNWIEDLEKGGTAIDQNAKAIYSSVKQAIRQQELVVAAVYKSVEGLKALLRAAPEEEKKILEAELRNNQQRLYDEYQKLLELKGELNDQSDQTIQNIEKEGKSQNALIETIKRWGLQILSITGLVKAFKAIIETSNAATEQFGFTIDGVKGSLQQLGQSLIPAANQTGNIVANMIKAYKNSKELANSIDSYNDAMKSNQVLLAEEKRSLEELEKVWRTTTNATEDREKALNDWIVIRKGQAARELEIERGLNDALVKEIVARPNLAAMGVSQKQVESFTKIYATNPALISKAEEYWKSLSGATAAGMGVGVSEQTRKYYENLKKEIESLLPVGTAWSDVMNMAAINTSLNTKQVDALIGSFTRLSGAEAGAAEVESSVARWMSTIEKKGQKAEDQLSKIRGEIRLLNFDAGNYGSGSDAELNKELARIGEKYQEDLRQFKDNEEAKKLLAERYSLEISEAYIKDLKKRQDEETKYAQKLQKLDPGRGYSILKRALGKSAVGDVTALRGTNQDAAKIEKQVNKNLEEQVQLRIEILNVAAGLVYSIGETIGLQGKELEQLDGMLNTFSQFASGNIAGAVGSLISTVIQAFPSAAEKYNIEIERLNKLLEQQTRLIDESQRKGGTQESIEKQISLLKEEETTISKALEKAEKWLKALGGGWGSRSQAEKVEKLKDDLIAVQNELEDANQALTDLLGGGVTENTIAETIAEGFREGKTSVDDFAEYTNRILIDAVMSAFQAEILGPEITALQEYISTALADKSLSTDEKAKIDERIKLIADANKELWDDLTGALDLEEAGTTGLSGGISRQLTEDTGSELSGLFRRFADDNRAIKDYTKVGVNHLVGIEQNTYNTVEELKLAVTELRAINTNTKPVYSGEL